MGEIDIVFVKNQSFCSLNVFLNIFLFFHKYWVFSLLYEKSLFSHSVIFIFVYIEGVWKMLIAFINYLSHLKYSDLFINNL